MEEISQLCGVCYISCSSLRRLCVACRTDRGNNLLGRQSRSLYPGIIVHSGRRTVLKGKVRWETIEIYTRVGRLGKTSVPRLELDSA